MTPRAEIATHLFNGILAAHRVFDREAMKSYAELAVQGADLLMAELRQPMPGVTAEAVRRAAQLSPCSRLSTSYKLMTNPWHPSCR